MGGQLLSWPPSVAPILVGGACWSGLPTDASTTFDPGDELTLDAISTNGWPVNPDADAPLISGTPNDLYRLNLRKVSSVISAPAWAVAPATIGAPQVSQLLSCTAGDLSGSPELGYQWRRSAEVITGAKAATYTLVQADARKKLLHTTCATNAGSTTLVMPAAVETGNTDSVMDANQNSALFGR